MGLKKEVDEEAVKDSYCVKNWVVQEWLPIIGSYGFYLYSIYAASADEKSGNCAFSLKTLEEFTFLSSITITMNNWLLESCGLIQIESGINGYANQYHVVACPPHVTPQTLAPIVTRLKSESTARAGQNWRVFKANALERISKWKPLSQCGRVSQFDRHRFYQMMYQEQSSKKSDIFKTLDF